jgi:predicted nucleic acid-binding protein
VSVFVDSDILIHVSRGRDLTVLGRWSALAGSVEAVFCSPITVAELWSGTHPGERSLVADLFRELVCVPIDEETARLAADYIRKYRKSHGIEVPDALIAAAASLSGAALWTHNRKHFPMKDLKFY